MNRQEAGDPQAAERLLAQDYKYKSRPPTRLRFRKTRARGAIQDRGFDAHEADIFGHGWGTQELLVANADDDMEFEPT